MKLVFLGTGGYHPTDHRETLCLLLPECGVMLDAGTSIYRAAQYLSTNELDIFLTHAHLDHVVGLTYLFSILRRRPLNRITLYGEAAKLRAVEEHLFARPLFPLSPPFEMRPLEAASPIGGGGRVTPFPLQHPGGAVGYRLDWPTCSLAYVTDAFADLNAPYVSRIQDVDLLVHECHFSDEQAELAEKTGHTYTSLAAQIAVQAKVKRLLLVHFNPLAPNEDPIGLSTARRIFPNTDLAADYMEVEF